MLRAGQLSVYPCAAAAALVAAGLAVPDLPRAEAKLHTAEFLSKTYVVDRKYKSMTGPSGTQTIHLLTSSPAELLWVTGFKAVVVGADGEASMSQEFMCHSNLDLNGAIHRRLFNLDRVTPNRVFTLSQGQQEIEFPKGYGLPILSNEPFDLTTQVLNHNIEGQSFSLRHKVTVEFLRDAELETPMKPLMQVSANGLVLVQGKDGYFNIPEADAQVHGPGCLPGASASNAGGVYTDEYGRKFTAHWVVKPGREVNSTNVTRFMRLPFDTTLHYIAVHLHPFAESLELRDLTAAKSLYLSKARPAEGKIGLSHVDYLSSEEGIPLSADHEYELVSVYNNTTPEPVDSMAVMYLYVLDREFKRPKP
ncbi:MAG TPA: hypothetical protein VGK94_00565 [Candidatus Polarisedimenticolia bacterium]|jgi:hypothetical protein